MAKQEQHDLREYSLSVSLLLATALSAFVPIPAAGRLIKIQTAVKVSPNVDTDLNFEIGTTTVKEGATAITQVILGADAAGDTHVDTPDTDNFVYEAEDGDETGDASAVEILNEGAATSGEVVVTLTIRP